MNKDNKKTEGILIRLDNGGALVQNLSDPFQCHQDDAWISPQLINQYDISQGALVKGDFEETPEGRKIINIDEICGLPPEKFKIRVPFKRLTAINPCEKFKLDKSKLTSMRIFDLISPIGKGSRGLIVSPPKAGKTTLLEHLAIAINASHPDVKLMMLLIDERPEEVTHFRRAVPADVLASSSDQSIEEHIALTEFTLSYITTELECGHDVVLLVDSLTRMGRVFNQGQRDNNRILSGGLGVGALEIPRKFFGLARNIENGGSITILATILVDTGSRMDQLIFEEFKGTGNSEIVLDRELADQRLFPAVDIAASGTRKEALLIGQENMDSYNKLQKELIDKKPKAALDSLLQLTKQWNNNEELLKSFR